MTYEEIVEKVRKTLKEADASGIEGHTAIQVNIIGEGEGAFYVELENGNINVEPYEYFDRDILVTATADNLMDVVEGRIDVINANLTGKITADGDLRKAEVLKNLRPAEKAVEEKAAPKKAPARKTAAKKTTEKKTTAKKTTAKKTAEKKDTAKKTAAKASDKTAPEA